MKYYLYILLCDGNSFYVGVTGDLKRRVLEHVNKESHYTKRFKELRLIYLEEFETQLEAEERELQIKGWTKDKKLALIQNNVDRLKLLSKPDSQKKW